MIADLHKDEQPRERLQQHGEEVLKNEELIAILLRTGTHNLSVIEVAKKLLNNFGNSLSQIAQANINDLMAIPGIGNAKAIELKAAFAIARRLSEEIILNKPVYNKPELIYKLMRPRFFEVNQEQIYVLSLNTKLELNNIELITQGLLSRSLIHPREVFKSAIKNNANSIILVHNHPSGDPQPSTEDFNVTESIADAGKVIDIKLVDHIIIGHKTSNNNNKPYYSFKEKGLI